jgi:OOP family OmpA-OmpF porin
MSLGLGVLAAVLTRPVLAQQGGGAVPKTATGWYAGGAIGDGGFRTGYDQTMSTIASTGATRATVSADAKETMWKAYYGYRFSPRFSIEGGYWNFGKPSYSASITAPLPVTTMRRSFSAEGYGADAVLWLPVTKTVSGFGKIGAIQTITRASFAAPGGALTALPAESVRKLNGRGGLGLQVDIRQDLAARFEIETVRNIGDAAKFGSADIVMWSLGMNYKF